MCRALHMACESGQEELAELLISHMSTVGIQKRTRSSSASAFDVLRRNDLGRMASRLEDLANARFGSADELNRH